ncbi:hypothetical protein FHS62_001248 [Amphiplicatus metriothermophilus]|nr:MMPL family transporter [Amphiplicatus metriothermophilus]MBB5518450.1 hypothetical protein [Amphiplicatus metriothermophilus]
MQLAGVFAALMVALIAAPTLAPETFSFLQPLKIDTDPENMLGEDEPVRVYHNAMKDEFTLHDLIVVGVVDQTTADGVFTARTLSDVYALTEFAKTIRWEDDGATVGVIGVDIIAPSTVDNIEQAGLGSVSFDWLMPRPPETDEEARAVRARAERIPTLKDTLVSGDGKALALYIPITSKDASYRVARALREKIADFETGAEYYITGLPIAQDQFGVEMFRQMAISAPAAMLLIFILMWLFFRNVGLIVSPMLVAMISVIGAMGLLVATGNTVHIMSSMIPIFVMPIAVLDAVHILSDFYDRYPQYKDRRQTIFHVMSELWRPMLFTTLTTCAGFASLAFTPIPPVQVFGVFVSIGVFLAWLFTITLIPAYVMLMPKKALEKFGAKGAASESREARGLLARFLHGVGDFAVERPKAIVSMLIVALAVSLYGVSQIRINDNPVKWFAPDHQIRVADRTLNERFAGTYMAYLTLEPAAGAETLAALAAETRRLIEALDTDAAAATAARIPEAFEQADSSELFLATLEEQALEAREAAGDDAQWYEWDDVLLALDQARQTADIFKRPDMLRFIEGLQAHLEEKGVVGKTNALPDIVKTVHRELLLGEKSAFRIPDSASAVAQTLITYQNSHRPQDLFKLVTPDFRKANIWLQLKSGDNIDMNQVIEEVDAYMAANPAPVALKHDWFGLTYINVIWQKKMVWGMLTAFLGSFLIVLILMTFLFRSFWWGLVSMAPLTVTIAMIYGVIGLIGKDYDMPVAVLSALSLGLAVDYAIHFNARSRQIFERLGTWRETASMTFGEPARAIMRNVIVIGVGFLPLLLAPLVPYQTVGIFISAILLLAGATSLLALPAIITLFEKTLFRKKSGKGEFYVRHAN